MGESEVRNGRMAIRLTRHERLRKRPRYGTGRDRARPIPGARRARRQSSGLVIWASVRRFSSLSSLELRKTRENGDKGSLRVSKATDFFKHMTDKGLEHRKIYTKPRSHLESALPKANAKAKKPLGISSLQLAKASQSQRPKPLGLVESMTFHLSQSHAKPTPKPKCPLKSPLE